MCKKIWTSLSRTSPVGTISLFCVFATLKRNCFLPTSLFLFIYAIAAPQQFSTIVITSATSVIPLSLFLFIINNPLLLYFIYFFLVFVLFFFLIHFFNVCIYSFHMSFLFCKLSTSINNIPLNASRQRYLIFNVPVIYFRKFFTL